MASWELSRKLNCAMRERLSCALGGLGGSTIASWVIVAAAAASSWTAHLNLVMILSGPLLGGLVGLIASAYPAIRASYIQPAIAVRAN